jgi:bis(5'-nucleosidyl)-tetraphosphatase
MKRERSYGVIVVHIDEAHHVQFLLVQGYGNYWGFPKGHTEPNETALETALRELQEETGITDIDILEGQYFDESYVIEKKKGSDIDKSVRYFVGKVSQKKARRQRSEIKQLGWFSLEHAKQLVVPDKKEILDRVYASL